MGLSACILTTNALNAEFVCDGCGTLSQGDPRKGCTCIDGLALVQFESQMTCVDEFCATNGTECHGHGKCGEFGTCECFDDYDQYAKCKVCRQGYKLVDAICVQNFCTTGRTQCNNRGSCDLETIKCKCEPNFTGDSCELCKYGLQFVKNKTQCADPNCVINDTVCSDSGFCDTTYNPICSCENGASGAGCQCPKGQTQLTLDFLECGYNLCQSFRGKCFRRGKCIKNGNELFCENCRQFIFNDPRQGCQGCLPGAKHFGEPSEYICKAEKCITGESLCSGRGECLNSGICKCNDLNADSQTGCSTCDELFTMVDDKCVADSCLESNQECAGNGKCQNDKCICESEMLDETVNCGACKSVNIEFEKMCKSCTSELGIISGQCLNMQCTQNQKFNFENSTCDDNIIMKGKINRNLFAMLIVIALSLVAIMSIGFYLFARKYLIKHTYSITDNQIESEDKYNPELIISHQVACLNSGDSV
ncbi:Cysteine-rich membrane protein 2 [Spironucleus salmonicida]|uniref:Cysteine-rich membrane protein 2 n=1 Tax=Spironucleus salmonicida TaxID=348837 RepID=V6LIX6_9EUKA|nr:Cysteine-rich membrane protein 2 [Spironucleus salmonicida]|eukprot:EST44517.1 Cysteine-rich membrane protein 2 [Spironucleus salmonicida]